MPELVDYWKSFSIIDADEYGENNDIFGCYLIDGDDLEQMMIAVFPATISSLYRNAEN